VPATVLSVRTQRDALAFLHYSPLWVLYKQHCLCSFQALLSDERDQRKLSLSVTDVWLTIPENNDDNVVDDADKSNNFNDETNSTF